MVVKIISFKETALSNKKSIFSSSFYSTTWWMGRLGPMESVQRDLWYRT